MTKKRIADLLKEEVEKPAAEEADLADERGGKRHPQTHPCQSVYGSKSGGYSDQSS